MICQPPSYDPLSPLLRISTRKLGTTRLELLQDIHGIRAVQVHRCVHARTSPTNLLDHVVGVRSANNWYFRCEPLLKGFCDKVAIRGKPPGQGRADVDRLLGIRGVGGGCEDDVAFVDGDVLLCGGGYPHLDVVSISRTLIRSEGSMPTYLACLALPLIYYTLLYKPQPITENAVQQEVRDYGRQCVGLAGFPAKLPVVVEECAGNGDSRVAKD